MLWATHSLSAVAFDEKIIFGTKSFEKNNDYSHEVYKTKFGIYSPGCGMDNVMLSWGHDEYLYHIVKDQSTIPVEGLAMIRYHSFYPWHKEGAYRELMDKKDEQMLKAVLAFNPYDLYSKSDAPPSAAELKVSCSIPTNSPFPSRLLISVPQPYYSKLIDEYFPNPVVRW